MSDDVSVMVMDMLPEGTSWPEVILPYMKKEKKGLFTFGAAPPCMAWSVRDAWKPPTPPCTLQAAAQLRAMWLPVTGPLPSVAAGKKKDAPVTDQVAPTPPILTYIADVDALEEYEWNADEGRLTLTEQAIEDMKVRGGGWAAGRGCMGQLPAVVWGQCRSCFFTWRPCATASDGQKRAARSQRAAGHDSGGRAHERGVG
jgi:hypothetical protein